MTRKTVLTGLPYNIWMDKVRAMLVAPSVTGAAETCGYHRTATEQWKRYGVPVAAITKAIAIARERSAIAQEAVAFKVSIEKIKEHFDSIPMVDTVIRKNPGAIRVILAGMKLEEMMEKPEVKALFKKVKSTSEDVAAVFMVGRATAEAYKTRDPKVGRLFDVVRLGAAALKAADAHSLADMAEGYLQIGMASGHGERVSKEPSEINIKKDTK